MWIQLLWLTVPECVKNYLPADRLCWNCSQDICKIFKNHKLCYNMPWSVLLCALGHWWIDHHVNMATMVRDLPIYRAWLPLGQYQIMWLIDRVHNLPRTTCLELLLVLDSDPTRSPNVDWKSNTLLITSLQCPNCAVFYPFTGLHYWICWYC